MGEYVKHLTKGDVLKIGVLDIMYYTREELLALKSAGYKGYCDGQYTDDLDEILNDPHAIYSFPRALKAIEEVVFLLPVPEEFLPVEQGNGEKGDCTVKQGNEFTLPTRRSFKHENVHLHHNGMYHFREKCLEADKAVIHARVKGLQYISGQPCTVFHCNCCGYPEFGIDHVTAMFLRNLYPHFKDVICSFGDMTYREKCIRELGEYEELDLLELLEIMAMKYNSRDFHKLLGDSWDDNRIKCEKVITEAGYPTIHNFYCVNSSGAHNEKEKSETPTDSQKNMAVVKEFPKRCLYCDTPTKSQICPDCKRDIDSGVDPDRHKAEFNRLDEETRLNIC